jgi:hypothetical protein
VNGKKRAAPKRPAADWKSPGSADELGEAEQVAHAIITERSDLMPSVERIMNSTLESDERVGALKLFRDSLHTPGDANRDPRVAIESSRTNPVASDATRL